MPAPREPKRRTRNSSKVNLIFSGVFHAVLIGALFYFAAREGMLGKKLKTIAVSMTKEKPPEKPKEKEPEPKAEPPKTAKMPEPKMPVATAPKTAPPPTTAAPVAPPPVAPPANMVPSFDFEGGKQVVSATDPVEVYRNFVEYTLRTRWNRPENIADEKYVAEIELNIDPTGKVLGSQWLKGSGDPTWDSTVKKAVAQVSAIGKEPPKGFPAKFLVRFDVLSTIEPVFQ